MTDLAAAFHDVYGRHAAKKIARQYLVSIPTAIVWLKGRVPLARRSELATALLAELDRQDAQRAALRRMLAEVVENAGTEPITNGARAWVCARAAARAAGSLDRADARAQIAARELRGAGEEIRK